MEYNPVEIVLESSDHKTNKLPIQQINIEAIVFPCVIKITKTTKIREPIIIAGYTNEKLTLTLGTRKPGTQLGKKVEI